MKFQALDLWTTAEGDAEMMESIHKPILWQKSASLALKGLKRNAEPYEYLAGSVAL